MPSPSKASFRAMQAAAHGDSTLGIPKSVGQEFVNATPNPKSLPERVGDHPAMHLDDPPKKKKKHMRGGKPRGAPGAKHLDALSKAHGAGDFHSSSNHALAYVNEVKKHVKGLSQMGMAADNGPMVETPGADQYATPGFDAKAQRAQLAKIAMSRSKKPPI